MEETYPVKMSYRSKMVSQIYTVFVSREKVMVTKGRVGEYRSQ